MKKKISPTTIILTILCVVLISVIVVLCVNGGKNDTNDTRLDTDQGAADWNGNQKLPQPSLGDTPAIAIPGFDSLVFIADTKTQSVNFYNPEVNDCLFLMTLYIEGKEMWQSGYVAPGKGYYTIELLETLPECSTTGYLRVQCFKSDGTALNSARINFELTVIKGEN